MISRIHSVLIGTEDMKRLAPFYRDVLGLKAEMEGDEFALFLSDGAQLAIEKHSEVSGRAKEPNRVMLDFQVEDCQAEFERLSKQGVKFIRTPSKDGDFTVATLVDPDGNVLQLFQEG